MSDRLVYLDSSAFVKLGHLGLHDAAHYGTLMDDAASVGSPELRSLEAVHLAGALTLGPDLDAVVTCDERLQAAAAAVGLAGQAPT
ncbi:MAG: hypothetical protein ACREQM_11845 [Candidatus Dormibacteraceae bacterium]